MAQIIVVDDDPANSMLMKMILELDGYNAVACLDADEAEKAVTVNTQVFVIDVNLARGLSGIDLLNSIRAGKTNAPSNTVVIMTSGDYRREVDCRRAGANEFLLKPYMPNILSAQIQQLLKENI
jgi:DNA-binding NtrC family response regulator